LWAPRLGVVLGYVTVALLFTWPLPAHVGTALTGDPGGDTGVYVWNQWVFQHEALVNRQSPLTTERILSLTQRVNLTQHNYTAFLDLLALPLMPVLGVVTTFNVVYLTATILTALFTYLLVRRVTEASPIEAWLAGLAFAWSPVLVARSTGHFSLVAAAPLPAFILCLINAGRSRRPFDAALAGLAVAWAAFSDVYYAVYCLLIATAYFAAQVVEVQREPQRARQPWVWVLDLLILCVAGLIIGLLLGRGGHVEVFGLPVSIRGLYTPVFVLTALLLVRALFWWRPRVLATWSWSPATARAAFIGLLACAGPLSPVLYGIGENIVGGHYVIPATLWRSSPRGVDLLAWVDPNPNHVVARWAFGDQQAAAPTAYMEHTAALSIVALAVVGVAMWRGWYRPKAGWIAFAIGSALLALGPFLIVAGMNTYVPGPWSLLRYVPIIGAARTPTRFAVLTALALAVLFGGALAALGRRFPERRRAIAAVIGAFLVFELCPAPRTLYSAEIPSLYHIIAADPRAVRVLHLPFGVRDGLSSAGNFTAEYQYFQTLHRKPLIGGYLSRIPRPRIDRMRREFPIVDNFMTLSEGGTLTAEQISRAHRVGQDFVERANIGWVVIDYATAPPALVKAAFHAFDLDEVAHDGRRALYATAR
ncbi:MAG: hypothetical protein LC791_18870, partial [Acidobacteria bacterium]|nr:hypothetical protein [Acidobacteriota bacterium]